MKQWSRKHWCSKALTTILALLQTSWREGVGVMASCIMHAAVQLASSARGGTTGIRGKVVENPFVVVVHCHRQHLLRLLLPHHKAIQILIDLHTHTCHRLWIHPLGPQPAPSSPALAPPQSDPNTYRSAHTHATGSEYIPLVPSQHFLRLLLPHHKTIQILIDLHTHTCHRLWIRPLGPQPAPSSPALAPPQSDPNTYTSYRSAHTHATGSEYIPLVPSQHFLCLLSPQHKTIQILIDLHAHTCHRLWISPLGPQTSSKTELTVLVFTLLSVYILFARDRN